MGKLILNEMQRKSLDSSPDEIVTFENGKSSYGDVRNKDIELDNDSAGRRS